MASAQGNELDQTFIAESTLAALQYTFVKSGASAYGCLPCGAGERVLGINQGKATAGIAAQIRTARGTTSKLLVGVALAVGDKVMSDSAGAGTPSTTALDKVAAIALEAGAAGEIIEVMLLDVYLAAS